jgi:hypothetical protein
MADLNAKEQARSIISDAIHKDASRIQTQRRPRSVTLR